LASIESSSGRSVAEGLRDIIQLVQDDLVEVEKLFERQIASDVTLVGEIARYVRDGGGKRIRPALLLLAGRLCGYRGERAVLLAGVVEFIHSATLLHDDIIDEATVRRGRRSVNSRWGNDITVLLGDFLYTKSMSMALSQDNLPILRLLSDVTLRMIEGELLEIEACADIDATPDGHLDVIRRKTADLFAACVRIGAMLGEVGEEKERALASYGLNLGICFQMVDDLLDYTADARVLGKPVLNDLREGRVTLPAILLVQRAGAEGRELVRRALEDRELDADRAVQLLELARTSGALSEAQGMAEDYAEAARRDLLAFEQSPFRDALEALPGFVLARDH
jgi:octaprenyl-diphosphate synthase